MNRRIWELKRQKTEKMKKNILNWMAIALMAFVCVGFTACGSDDDDSSSSSNTPDEPSAPLAMKEGYYVSLYGDNAAKQVAQDCTNASDVYGLSNHSWWQYTEPAIHVKKGNVIEIVNRCVGDFWGKGSPDNWYDVKSYSTHYTANGRTTFANVTLYFYFDGNVQTTMTYTLDGDKIITSDSDWSGYTYQDGKIMGNGATMEHVDVR